MLNVLSGSAKETLRGPNRVKEKPLLMLEPKRSHWSKRACSCSSDKQWFRRNKDWRLKSLRLCHDVKEVLPTQPSGAFFPLNRFNLCNR